MGGQYSIKINITQDTKVVTVNASFLDAIKQRLNPKQLFVFERVLWSQAIERDAGRCLTNQQGS
jgi:hypothetical protein